MLLQHYNTILLSIVKESDFHILFISNHIDLCKNFNYIADQCSKQNTLTMHEGAVDGRTQKQIINCIMELHPGKITEC